MNKDKITSDNSSKVTEEEIHKFNEEEFQRLMDLKPWEEEYDLYINLLILKTFS